MKVIPKILFLCYYSGGVNFQLLFTVIIIVIVLGVNGLLHLKVATD